MKRTIQVRIFRGEHKYVAECLDLPVVTEASTLDELAANIQEAVSLHLEGEELAAMGFSDDPTNWSLWSFRQSPDAEATHVIRRRPHPHVCWIRVSADIATRQSRETAAAPGKRSAPEPDGPSLHDELDRGTLKAILRQASRYIKEADLHPILLHGLKVASQTSQHRTTAELIPCEHPA